MKNIFRIMFEAGSVLLAITACNVEPEFHSEVSPDTFFDSKEAVLQRFYRPFTHARWTFAQDASYFYAQELSADAFCNPVRGGQNAARDEDYKIHYHEYPVSFGMSHQCYISRMSGVARCWATLNDLSEVKLSQFGFTEEDWKNWKAQINTMAGLYYLQGLDLYGGLPLYSEPAIVEKPRSSASDTFYFIEKLFLDSMPYLEKKTELGGEERGDIRQGMAAIGLMRLYLNAEAYIGVPMYDKAAKVAQDILDGAYGTYALDEDWTVTFGFENDRSKEIIWSIPSERAQLETDAYYLYGRNMPHRMSYYFGGLTASAGENIMCLTPSLDGFGVPYTTKLGRPFAKFNDADLRKKPYNYLGNGKYEGMFVYGELVNPSHPEWKVTGKFEYSGQVLNLVDCIARKSEGGTESSMETGEENSGVRLVKFSPRPNINDVGMLFDPDIPLARLSEAYYTLAECKLREGNASEAADLINHVRKRYFEGGNDPDPCPSNMDKWRMLDEWMIEFLGECRRRTDLIRWGQFTEGEWWDHKPDGADKAYLARFPFSSEDIDASENLEQNEGYTR
ncbi:MAG: RagB/SusD family nutrient uptake outer membrane protein [Bacteroidales bacterium]|nr:RagB/SusD family nutrient uptake outer membrane protein [Bacteroidales bacterium]